MKFIRTTSSWSWLYQAYFNGKELERNNIEFSTFKRFYFEEEGLLYVKYLRSENNYYLIKREKPHRLCEVKPEWDVYKLDTELEILFYKSKYWNTKECQKQESL